MGVFLATVILVNPGIIPERIEWEQGQKARRDIVSEVSFSVVDKQALSREEKRLSDSKTFYYGYDTKVPDRVLGRIQSVFEKARAIKADTAASPPEKVRTLLTWVRDEQKVEFHSPDVAASLILNHCEDEAFFKILAATLKKPIELLVEDLKLYRERDKQIKFDSLPENVSVKPDNLIDVREFGTYLTTYFARQKETERELNREKQQLLILLSQAYAEPAIRHLPEETERHLNEETEKLRAKPPRRTFEWGEVLVVRGQMIGQEENQLIQTMYNEAERMNKRRLAAIVVFVAVLIALVCHYVRQFRSDLNFSTGTVFQVALPVLLALLFGHLALKVVDAERFPDAAGYAFPAAMIGMLAVILFDARSAVLLVTAGSLAFWVLTGLDSRVLLVAFFGGLMSVTALTTAKARQEVLKVGFLVGLVNAVMILLAHFMDDPPRLRWGLFGWGVVNGVFCGVVTMPALVAFERLFGVVTDIGLLELTGLDHPLLKELEEEAPGSFQHSLNVCKLSEAAAKAIGANSLLVRAGLIFMMWARF